MCVCLNRFPADVTHFCSTRTSYFVAAIRLEERLLTQGVWTTPNLCLRYSFFDRNSPFYDHLLFYFVTPENQRSKVIYC